MLLLLAVLAVLGILVLAGNKPGHEIEFPMAVSSLGGLTTSTLLNLALMPALHGKFGRVHAKLK